jgi:hypothetical protein
MYYTRWSSKHFWRKTLVKSADLHPRQGNLLQRNILTGLNKNLSLQHKIGWRPAEKIALFQHASSSTRISMARPPEMMIFQREKLSWRKGTNVWNA